MTSSGLWRRIWLGAAVALMAMLGVFGSPHVWAAPAPSYHVSFTHMSEQDRANAKVAMDHWEEAVGDNNLFVITDEPGAHEIVLTTALDHQNQKSADEVVLGDTETVHLNQREIATVTLNQNATSKFFQDSEFTDFNALQRMIWTHEIGHALGLKHAGSEADVMNRAITRPNQVITARDVRQLAWHPTPAAGVKSIKASVVHREVASHMGRTYRLSGWTILAVGVPFAIVVAGLTYEISYYQVRRRVQKK